VYVQNLIIQFEFFRRLRLSI